MHKEILVKKILERLYGEKKALEQSHNENKEVANRAPGPMESHSDTSRFQYNQVANEFQERAETLGKIISVLEGDGFKNLDRPGIGSVFETEENQTKVFYFIVPEGAGGISFDAKDFVLKTIAPGSTLEKALTSSQTENEIEVTVPSGTKKIKILNRF